MKKTNNEIVEITWTKVPTPECEINKPDWVCCKVCIDKALLVYPNKVENRLTNCMKYAIIIVHTLIGD